MCSVNRCADMCLVHSDHVNSRIFSRSFSQPKHTALQQSILLQNCFHSKARSSANCINIWLKERTLHRILFSPNTQVYLGLYWSQRKTEFRSFFLCRLCQSVSFRHVILTSRKDVSIILDVGIIVEIEAV